MSEKARLSSAKKEGEIKLRQVWVSQLEKEIAAEKKLLGIDDIDSLPFDLNDDDLLAALGE